jgi:hypothetical protein
VTRFAALVVVASACSTTEIDISGVYDVDTDVASEPCGNDQPVAQPWPFVELLQNDLVYGYWMKSCSDQAATNCTGNKVTDAFTEPIDNGWIGVLYGTEGTMPCVLHYTEQVAKLSGAHLIVERSTYSEEAGIDQCTVHEAELRGAQMTCVRHEKIDATRL